jgi:hypothetical protein
MRLLLWLVDAPERTLRRAAFRLHGGGSGVCLGADLRRRISPARQMQSRRGGASFSPVKHVPRGESLDRLLAAVLIALGQLELWVGNVDPGLSKAAAMPLTIVIPGLVAFRRRWPLGDGIGVVLGPEEVFAAGAHN